MTNFTSGSDWANGVALQADGKVVAAGFATQSRTNNSFALARYHSDGTLDTSFSNDGKLTTDFTTRWDPACGLAIQADGKIVAAGEAGYGAANPTFALARYNDDGALDTSFSADGKVRTDFTAKEDYALGVAIQADGKIVAAGEAGYAPDLDLRARSLRPSAAMARCERTSARMDLAFGVAIQVDGRRSSLSARPHSTYQPRRSRSPGTWPTDPGPLVDPLGVTTGDVADARMMPRGGAAEPRPHRREVRHVRVARAHGDRGPDERGPAGPDGRRAARWGTARTSSSGTTARRRSSLRSPPACAWVAAWAEGKWLFLPLEPGYVLLLGEWGGRIRFHARGEALPAKRHLDLTFTTGAAFSATTQMWGGVHLSEAGHEHEVKYVKDMRPTPVDEQFDRRYFGELVAVAQQGGKRSVKGLLTQDQLIPGLGNAIAQDIMFRARLHPRRSLADAE